MLKILVLLCGFACLIPQANATTRQSNATQTSAYNYNYMYPFMNNTMRQDLNPGTSVELNSNPISTVVRTASLSNAKRRVVARPQTTATSTQGNRTNTIQQGTSARSAVSGTNNAKRRVVARTATNNTTNSIAKTGTRRVAQRSARGDASYLGTASANASSAPQSTTVSISSARCLADYIECMNGYCEHEDTPYNKCYCSAKLTQIDSQYQSKINKLITQIIQLQNSNIWSAEEMNEYWMSTIGQYTNENRWVNLDNALNIDWASMESRVRGQQAFVTGHEYCSQHLRGCSYMASNMRDAYRSEISRDCATYEANLQKIQNIAESIIEANR